MSAMANEDQYSISTNQALKTATKHIEGKILSNDIETKDSNIVYRVKILTKKGVVNIIFIDANTGEIL
jgi:uncharacterized membrane protein YkoI